MDSVHGPWTVSSLGPRWTAVVRLGARRCACRSSASGRYGSSVLGGDTLGGGVGHGGLTLGITGAREVVEWQRDGGEGGGGLALDAGSLRARREGKEGRGRSGEERGCRGALLEGQRGGRTGKGIRRPVVECLYWPSGSVGRGNGGGVRSALSRGRRKPSRAHAVVRGEGGSRLGRPEAKAQWGGRLADGPGRRRRSKRGGGEVGLEGGRGQAQEGEMGSGLIEG
jgi:hypothetical protein